MPYVPPGPASSSQAVIPRRSVAKAVLDEAREKSRGGAAGTVKPRSGSTSTSTGTKARSGSVSVSQPQANGDGIDMSASTGELAHQLEVTHIAQPAITPSVNLAGPHVDDPGCISASEPSSDASTSSVSRTDSDSDLEAKRRLSLGNDAVAGYKHALYQYTRDLLKEAKDTTQKVEAKNGAFPQFGAKPSGMQRMAAKKALARQLNG